MACSVVSERFFLFGQDFALFRFGRVQLDVALPLFGKIVFVENGFDRALWYTGFTVDAFFWMDVDHLVAFVEAFDRADDHAIGVLATRAGFGNDVSHV